MPADQFLIDRVQRRALAWVRQLLLLVQDRCRDCVRCLHSAQPITAFHERSLCRFRRISPFERHLTGEDSRDNLYSAAFLVPPPAQNPGLQVLRYTSRINSLQVEGSLAWNSAL